MTQTTVALVRHGQTDWNLLGKVQGATDIPLNATGEAQARETAASLQGQDWGALLCSPLQRARTTAQIIASILDLPEPIIVPELQERGFGELEGLTGPERTARQAQPEPLIGVESTTDVVRRAQPAITRQALARPGQHVLIVTHGGVIGSLLLKITDGRLPGREDIIPNGAVNEFDIDGDGGWTLRAYAAEPSRLYPSVP
ncbi:MAG: histidine phosphatase family protein [Microbacteriaceae bacterium]|jgi:broad specificity phosphatase PhoE|nr:histidine phosphatase family protein [Microbacteriaceae bacterium]